MSRIDLLELEDELDAQGFAVRHGDLRGVSLATIIQGRWHLALQKGGAVTSQLRPVSQEHAPPRTLSALHGLDAQPLHTDGAHLAKMPDVVVLHASTPSSTATSVWMPDRAYPSALSSGVFTVRGNDGSFLAHALEHRRLRFDPACMSPADQLAKEAASFLSAGRDKAHVHNWNDEDLLLFIDNRSALHGREAVVNDEDARTRVLDRAAYYVEAR